MTKNKTIKVLSTEVKVKTIDQGDFICLTDIAKSRNPKHPDDLIRNWLRNRNTLELLGIWEQLHNPDFNPVEFDGIRKQAGLNSFTLTPKQWIASTQAIGLSSRAGRLRLLNQTAIRQMRLLTDDSTTKKLEGGKEF